MDNDLLAVVLVEVYEYTSSEAGQKVDRVEVLPDMAIPKHLNSLADVAGAILADAVAVVADFEVAPVHNPTLGADWG